MLLNGGVELIRLPTKGGHGGLVKKKQSPRKSLVLPLARVPAGHTRGFSSTLFYPAQMPKLLNLTLPQDRKACLLEIFPDNGKYVPASCVNHWNGQNFRIQRLFASKCTEGRIWIIPLEKHQSSFTHFGAFVKNVTRSNLAGHEQQIQNFAGTKTSNLTNWGEDLLY